MKATLYLFTAIDQKEFWASRELEIPFVPHVGMKLFLDNMDWLVESVTWDCAAHELSVDVDVTEGFQQCLKCYEQYPWTAMTLGGTAWSITGNADCDTNLGELQA